MPAACASTASPRASAAAPVRFGGRIGLSGYQLSEFDVTATGQDMNLRYPEGMRSIVDAEPRAAGTRDGADGDRHREREERELGARLRRIRRAVQRADRRRRRRFPSVEGQVAAASNVRFDVRLIAPSRCASTTIRRASSPAPI